MKDIQEKRILHSFDQPPQKAIKNNPKSVVRYFDEENSKEAKRIAEYIKSETSIEISTAKIIYDTGGSLKGKYKVWLNK